MIPPTTIPTISPVLRGWLEVTELPELLEAGLEVSEIESVDETLSEYCVLNSNDRCSTRP